MDDGRIIEMKAGDLFYIEPGQDSWEWAMNLMYRSMTMRRSSRGPSCARGARPFGMTRIFA